MLVLRQFSLLTLFGSGRAGIRPLGFVTFAALPRHAYAPQRHIWASEIFHGTHA